MIPRGPFDFLISTLICHGLGGVIAAGRKSSILLLGGVLGLGAQPTRAAQALYAATAAGGPGELYIIDPSTGASLQDIGPLNDLTGKNYPITGLAFNPITGVLYGSTASSQVDTAAKLVTINISTAAVTLIGSFNAGPANDRGTPATMADLGFNAAGLLYGIGSVGGPNLYSINLATAQATLVGASGLPSTVGGGLAISEANSFFGTPTITRFGTYNSTTGAYTQTANPDKPVGGGYAALDFNGNGLLYGLNLGSRPPDPIPTHLVAINPADGMITDIGASVPSLDAIAFQPAAIPEAGILTPVLGGAFALLLFKARRPQ